MNDVEIYMGETHVSKGFQTWRCIFVSSESRREVYRDRRINVAERQCPPYEMQMDGRMYRRTGIINGVAYYDAAQVVQGLSVEQLEAKHIARVLGIGAGL